ncbi:MAG TPA: NUDIX domain-containing protein [Candidatus Saccharimonadales bacterium]|nr:NUDIX domain-containing protein [Candidatus Saccharimonadales bacterium]
MKTQRITVRGIIFNDNKMLAQQLKPGSDGKKREYWCTPGGGLEPQESLLEGLHREMIEETGVAPEIGNLLFIQQYEDVEKEFLEFFFHIKNAADYEAIDLASTTHGLLEIEATAFVNPREYNVLPAFLQTIDIQSHIDGNHPVVISNEMTRL